MTVENTNSVDISQLAKGFYILCYNDSTNRKRSIKFKL